MELAGLRFGWRLLLVLLQVLILSIRASFIGRAVVSWWRRHAPESMKPLVTHTKEVTSSWLHGVLLRNGDIEPNEEVQILDCHPIGDGKMSSMRMLRYRVTGKKTAHESCLVIKSMPGVIDQRIFTLLIGLHRSEISSYQHLYGRKDGIPCVKLLYHAIDGSGQFLMLLEAVVRGQVVPISRGFTSVPLIDRIIRDLASYHSMSWHSPSAITEPRWEKQVEQGPMGPVTTFGTSAVYLSTWKNTRHLQPDMFKAEDNMETIAMYLENMPEIHRKVLQRMPVAWTHGDLNPGNFMVENDSEYRLLDWQAAGIRPALFDLAYFIGLALPIEVRRQHEDRLLRLYCGEILKRTGYEMSFERCQHDFALCCVSLLVPLAFMGYLVQNDPNNAMMHIEASGKRALSCIRDYNVHKVLQELLDEH